MDSADMRTQEERTSGAVGPKRVRRKFRPRTPEPVQGRKHLEIQTESYLEELSDIPVVKEIECQTDAFLDRPETPIFIPAKTGKDAETQIDEGDLFDFEEEVRPILEILVGKTLEQSLLEVMEEEELAALMAQQRAFLERRNNQLPEVHRLQEQERRRREERERRMAEQKRALQEEKEVAEKIAARALTQQQLADLVPSVLASLRREGYFYDPVERDVETHFFPRLMEDVQRVLQKNCRARELLDVSQDCSVRGAAFLRSKAAWAGSYRPEAAQRDGSPGRHGFPELSSSTPKTARASMHELHRPGLDYSVTTLQARKPR
ncbi:radial spoke head protein 3 homolog isoform X3 [Oryzias melastigma]|uniref:radial spoke head protein 3 homolog isoform X3 n=1 Tax=Oryzias melastigma TaxID=30732 RepID=UPI00168D5471|nr:radial spoke head protein 3 homolog isoform X3 [Oryzias melastigma]